MGAVAIEARGLSRWFGQGDARMCAVNDVTFEARFQEMLYIVGPSGSGGVRASGAGSSVPGPG